MIKCIKESKCIYLFKISNIIKPENKILKVIDVRSYEKVNIEKYLKAVRELNAIGSDYLMSYSLIKEENGYIYLIMPEYYGSFEDYDSDCFLRSSLLRGEVRDENIFDNSNSAYIFEFFDDLVNGLSIIHEKGYYHGNIKYSNIFASNDAFILSDYCLYLLDEDKRKREDKRDIINIIDKALANKYKDDAEDLFEKDYDYLSKTDDFDTMLEKIKSI